VEKAVKASSDILPGEASKDTAGPPKTVSIPICVYLGFSHEQKEGKQWFLHQKIGVFPS
jgi:hypothetical protein